MTGHESIAVAGFGKTGRALLDFLLQNPLAKDRYRQIFLFNDDAIADEIKMQSYRDLGVEFLVGEDRFNQLAAVDRLVLSPGIDGQAERFKSLRQQGIEIISEIEFAFPFLKAPVIGVTGTNGKSTTVSLIHHILQKNGQASFLLGNIGKPLIAEVHRIPGKAFVVLELSSFQLEEIGTFRPHIAVLLNVTPDHLDRYPDMGAYLDAKLNIFKNQQSADFMVLNHQDPLLKQRAGAIGKANETWFSLTDPQQENCAYIENNDITLKWAGLKSRVSLEKNPLRGRHNLENLLAASLTVNLLGIPAAGIEAAIADFEGLAHRMQSLGKIGVVEFIDDSKATNVDAALKSIASIDEPLVLILGGKDKGSDYRILEDAIRQSVGRVLLIGKAAAKIYEQLVNLRERMVFVKDLAGAVRLGYEYLQGSGGVVLLAPGCASFDMFRDFEHRGEVFKEAFYVLQQEVGHG